MVFLLLMNVWTLEGNQDSREKGVVYTLDMERAYDRVD